MSRGVRNALDLTKAAGLCQRIVRIARCQKPCKPKCDGNAKDARNAQG